MARKIDSRPLAALLSSLVSGILLLFLLFPSNSNSLNSTSSGIFFPLLHHFLSTSEIAASLSLLSLSRKRKRTHQASSSSDEDERGSGPSELGRVDSGPDSFKLCFRMSASTFEWLAGLLEPLLECRDPVGSPLNLSAETRLGIGLFRLSTGASYADIAGRFRVSEPISKFCVKQLCRVLCTNYRFWVGFPSPIELGSVSAAFESLTGLPNCCGVIDCTRFKLARKNGSDEESIAAQIVVDSSSRILSIVAGYRGDNADFRVLKSSTLYKDIESGTILDSPPIYLNGVAVPQYLVGDGEYPLLTWLQVAFDEPATGQYEENFNAAHRLMRIPAIRTVASLKNWGILKRPVEAEFKTAVAYIGACSILHNALLMREDYSALSDGFADSSVDEWNRTGDNSVDTKASVIRSALATRAKEVYS